MSVCRFLSILFILSMAAAAHAQPAANKPIRLIAEAEDFKIEKGAAWQVVPYRENYYASTFAITFLSRMACLGAAEQGEGVATQVVQIPYDGSFQVFARFEQPFKFSVEFGVEIEQGGKKVFSQVYGRLEDAKIWPLNGHVRKPMERFWWGGTDNIVWQEKGAVQLAKGPATIRLVVAAQKDGSQPRVMAARRNVDVICLTNDTEGLEAQKKTRYLELDGWLTLAGDLFVRFTNPSDAAGPVLPVIQPHNLGQHSPYYIHIRDWPTVRVLKSGQLVSETKYQTAGPRALAVNSKNVLPVLSEEKYLPAVDPKKPKAKLLPVIPESEYLKPGETSGWAPLGPAVDSLYNSQWIATAQSFGKPGPLNLKLEFAIPDGKGGLKIIREALATGAGITSTFDIPGNVAPNAALMAALKERFWLPEIRTQKEALDWLYAEVQKFPKKGNTPKRMHIYNIGGFSLMLNTEEGRKLALALGDNTAVDQEGKKRYLAVHWRNPSLPVIEKQYEAVKDSLWGVSYGDEIHLPAVAPSDDEFAAWLKARGVSPEGAVYKTVAADKKHPLYFYSQLCAKEKGGQPFVKATEFFAKHGVRTGANYSPHANYLINEMDYVRPFKMKAMSMPWSEDYVWQIPEFSIQVTGYLTSGLRAGAKYHNQPIHMYILPHSPGNTPRSFRRSFYTAIGNGATIINYFCASPSAVGATENHVETADLGMWRQIHDCTQEAGIFEDYVLDARVRPAKVGLLLSPVDDVLTGSSNSTFAMHNNERKAIYYALRHAQVPVDFVTEDDVIDGLAKDYQVIYVNQQWMHSKALDALAKWVQAGGTVVALAGGGFNDEFQKPNPQALAFYGVKAQTLNTDPQLVSKYLLEENKPFLTKQDLPSYVPLDKVQFTLGDKAVADVPVIVWKQDLQPADAKVLGTYADGKPAVVEKLHGNGRVLLFGFLPGQAYLRSGLPLLPPDRSAVDAGFSHFLPTEMDPNLRAAIVDAVLPSGFVRPVTCSETLVESNCLDTGGTKLAVSLVNFTGKNIDNLTVRIAGLTNAKRIRSVEQGDLKGTVSNGATEVTLRLDVADMLLIDR